MCLQSCAGSNLNTATLHTAPEFGLPGRVSGGCMCNTLPFISAILQVLFALLGYFSPPQPPSFLEGIFMALTLLAFRFRVNLLFCLQCWKFPDVSVSLFWISRKYTLPLPKWKKKTELYKQSNRSILSWWGSVLNQYFGRSVVSDSLWPHGLQPVSLLCPWGFSRQEHWSGLPCPPPGDHPNLGIEPRSSCLAGRFFTIWVTREVQEYWSG